MSIVSSRALQRRDQLGAPGMTSSAIVKYLGAALLIWIGMHTFMPKDREPEAPRCPPSRWATSSVTVPPVVILGSVSDGIVAATTGSPQHRSRR